jgi:hypothetical protein
MSFTRVEQNGVEFYTLKANGASGMSLSGLARLCNINDKSLAQLLDNIARGSVRSKRLKRFTGKNLYLGVKALKGAVIVRAEVCSAIIRYYAFESDFRTEVAQYAYDKFADMGMENWIQSITGWQPVLPAAELTVEAIEAFILEQLEPGHCAIAVNPDGIIQMLQQSKFSADGYRLYLYLEMMALHDINPPIDHICAALDISLSTFKKWLPQVHIWSHCADWLQLQPRQGTEFEIQSRMQQELGGNIEVHTSAGRIDLVTATEVIEIKKIANWKDAFGEVLAKGQKFPQHSQRIHLFGDSDKLMPTIVEYCTPMGVAVTFELVVQDAIAPNPGDAAA